MIGVVKILRIIKMCFFSYCMHIFSGQLRRHQTCSDQMFSGQQCSGKLCSGQLCNDQLCIGQLRSDQLRDG